MGFHFDAQDEVGAIRSKTPKVQGQPYNYHAFLYSMSTKDALHDSGHQKKISVPAIKKIPVPPRQSSLPVVPPINLRRTKPASSWLSESSMDSVLPMQIRAGHRAGGFDFSSWIESTIDELHHPFNGNNPSHESRSPSLADVPWMQEEQDITFTKLRPPKYRETAVYSDPGSAVVSFPYCGCEGLDSSQYHEHDHSASEDIISTPSPSPRFSKNNSLRCSGDTLVSLSYNRSTGGSRDTFGRARAASSQSNISQKSQEERASEAEWMKPLPSVAADIGSPRIGDIISPTVFSPSTTEGCPSMPSTPGLVLDAQTARLSSGKATVVDLSSPVLSDHVASCMTEDVKVPSPAPSPPILQPLRLDYSPHTNSAGVNRMDTPLGARSMGERIKLGRAATSPAMTPASSQVELSSPLWGIRAHSPVRSNGTVKFPSHRRKLSPSAIAGVVADITALVQEFPAKMLCLDTSCIVAIRHDMHAEKAVNTPTSVAVSPASPADIQASMGLASDNTQPLFQRQNSTLTRSKRVNKLLSPLPPSLRAGTPPPGQRRMSSTKSLLRQRQVSDRYSPTMDMLSHYGEDITSVPEAPLEDETTCHPKVPDLAPVAAIFPDSDSWWQSTLYAHLIAYNYINKLNTTLQARPSQKRGRVVPDKAARTMGIPTMALMNAGDTAYTKVIEDLEKCMVRIMKSMMGKREEISGLSSPGGVLGRGELALVRALSQVVKLAEA